MSSVDEVRDGRSADEVHAVAWPETGEILEAAAVEGASQIRPANDLVRSRQGADQVRKRVQLQNMVGWTFEKRVAWALEEYREIWEALAKR